ncbi:MAG: hypothetical protein ACRBCJ_02175 [Hyphomicrobiaceae bacterium]
MTKLNKTSSNFVLLVAATTLLASRPVGAENFSINYDNLSFFEEPLAVDVAGFTLSYNQLYDLPVTFDFQNNTEDVAPNTVFEVRIERQLPNALTIGGAYAGSVEDGRDDQYQDAWAGYIGGVWGTVFGGEVTGLVREDTRRFRGVGNAELAFDDFLGQANDTGLAYRGQYSAFVVTAAGDDDGKHDIGVSYNRPSKFLDHRVTARYVNGDFHLTDGRGRVENRGGSLVGEIIYGSLLVDVGVGYEEFDGPLNGEDRIFTSFGLSYKYNQVSLSVESHLGELAGFDETSFSVGGRYDVARGLSLNLGYNYSDIEADFVEDAGQTSKMKLSVRYEY